MRPPLGPAPIVAAATLPPSLLGVSHPGGKPIGMWLRTHTAVPADTPPSGVMLAGAKAAFQPSRRAHPCMVCSLSFVILCSCTIIRSSPSMARPCAARWHPGHILSSGIARMLARASNPSNNRRHLLSRGIANKSEPNKTKHNKQKTNKHNKKQKHYVNPDDTFSLAGSPECQREHQIQ